MARFSRIDSQIRANRMILANRLRVPELNPFFANRASGGRKLRIAALRRFERIARTLCQRAAYGVQIRRGRIWRFWGAPIFSPEVPIYLFLRVLGPLDGKSGRPKNAKFNHDGSDPPFAALWLWILGFSANRFVRIDSRESPRFALPIGWPSKVWRVVKLVLLYHPWIYSSESSLLVAPACVILSWVMVTSSKVEIADWNLSSTELESGNAIGAFLQTPAPVLDKISGPMGAEILSSIGLGSGNLVGRAQFSPAPALDKNRSPMKGAAKEQPQQQQPTTTGPALGLPLLFVYTLFIGRVQRGHPQRG